MKTQKSKTKYLASFPETNPNPVLEADRSGKITFYNKAAFEVVRKLKKAVKISDFLPADLKKIFEKAGQKNKKQFYREVKIKNAIFGENIHLAGRSAVARIYATDISGKKRAERELVRYKNKLEDTVRERTRELKKTVVLLQESKKRYKELWDDAPVAYHVLDASGIIKQANKTEAKLLGYSTKEMIGRPIFNFVLPEQKEDARRRFKLKLSGEKVLTKEDRIYVKKGGTKIYVEIDDKIERGEDGKVVSIRTTMRDVTRRKMAEMEIERASRALQVLNESNRALIHASSESQLLREICRILVEEGGYRLAWVGLAETDRSKTVRPVAQAGFEKGYLERAKISWADNERGRGPTGTAIRTGKPGISKNILTNPRFFPWRDEALKRGYKSSIAIPLKDDGKIFGALNIYAPESEAFDREEVRLLSNLANDLAYGINTLRVRQSHEEAEQRLIESYKHLGIINRQISLLTDLEKTPKIKKKKEIADYILGAAVNSSQAGYGMLYRYDDDFNFRLLASSGVSEEKLKKLKAVSQESCHHLTTLIKDRVRTSAFTDECDPGAFNLIDGLKWFIILPLTEYKELLGFLLLGFSKTKSLSNEELEFYDVFATHASTALIQAGIF